MKLREVAEISADEKERRKVASWIELYWDTKNSGGTDFIPRRLNIVEGKVHYDGSIHLCNIETLPFKWGEISSEFCIDGRRGKKLKSFKNLPDKVHGRLYLSHHNVGSLEGMPKYVGYNCSLYGNELESLEGITPVIDGGLDLGSNNITSLKDVHKHIKKVEHIHITSNPIRSHLLGAMLIEAFEYYGLQGQSGELYEAATIINRHSNGSASKSNMLKAQQELIDADLDDFAEL